MKAHQSRVNRAVRCPVSTWGWLYLADEEARRMEGGPSKQDPDPHVSGQSEAYRKWGEQQIAQFAWKPYYQRQIRARMEALDRELQMARAAVNSSQADLDRLTESHIAVAHLLIEDGHAQ